MLCIQTLFIRLKWNLYLGRFIFLFSLCKRDDDDSQLEYKKKNFSRDICDINAFVLMQNPNENDDILLMA